MDLAIKAHGHGGQVPKLKVLSLHASLRQGSLTDMEVLRLPSSSVAGASRSGLGHASRSIAAPDLDTSMAPNLVRREWLGLDAQRCWSGRGAGNGGGGVEVKLRGGVDGGEERETGWSK